MNATRFNIRTKLEIFQKGLVPIAIVLFVVIGYGCGNNVTGEGNHEEDGEESGTQLALHETYDEVRSGARLILSYDVQSNSFIGTVENTTNKTLKNVRVEVHLSNGIELGPTIPTDLAPGVKLDITLQATSKPFSTWSAHPEVG